MTTFHITYPAWMADGLCGQVGGDTWYTEPGASNSAPAARRICRECPVKAECLEYALNHEHDYTSYGIWGGKTPRERMTLRREREAS